MAVEIYYYSIPGMCFVGVQIGTGSFFRTWTKLSHRGSSTVFATTARSGIAEDTVSYEMEANFSVFEMREHRVAGTMKWRNDYLVGAAIIELGQQHIRRVLVTVCRNSGVADAIFFKLDYVPRLHKQELRHSRRNFF